MTTITELGAAAAACTSIFHPQHPLHHLVLDLAEQIDQTLEQWLAADAPTNSFDVSMPPKTVSTSDDLLTNRAA
ncbi:hypothetical protein BB934_36705 (plasmid) [Microvirga ossetica]|uniref:Uncharacterized protein n=1 Tax=Microvirga ossetica TaxID=1882682 RepID=A0A1B2EUW9_9HYPH|nr:hypothetical protein [Microvirga ossetica]ANY83773.1 hypothetical protein BB934_36705 [Microvirga ossetica]